MITCLRLQPMLTSDFKISKLLNEKSFKAQVKSPHCTQERRGAMKLRKSEEGFESLALAIHKCTAASYSKFVSFSCLILNCSAVLSVRLTEHPFYLNKVKETKHVFKMHLLTV